MKGGSVDRVNIPFQVRSLYKIISTVQKTFAHQPFSNIFVSTILRLLRIH